MKYPAYTIIFMAMVITLSGCGVLQEHVSETKSSVTDAIEETKKEVEQTVNAINDTKEKVEQKIEDVNTAVEAVKNVVE